MKKNILKSIFIITSSLLIGCNDIDDQPQHSLLDPYNFIWKGLNKNYLYQNNIGDLSDSRFVNQDHLDQYLTGFNKPEDLFESLIYDRKNIDKYSFLFSDYTALEALLTGSSDVNGMEYGLSYKQNSQTEIFGWVKLILPNSNASTKAIERGTIFYAVDGIPLTKTNYRTLLSKNNYTLNLADYDNGQITPNGKQVTLSKTAYNENPVFINKVIDLGSTKVAYLMYNGFYSDYESQLNQAFGDFKNQGATHLVLDLRYNPGGSVATATRLASMITGQFYDQLLARQQWNSKITATTDPARFINNFTNKISNGSSINSLNLSKVYVLTTASTASASELIINCLKPYMDVVQIGKTTVGKNVGSITLYDSPTMQKKNVNPTHKYAMQPIVLKIVNKDGFGEYHTGISPTAGNELAENLGNMGVLGDPTEPYLAKALGLIQNNRMGTQKTKTFKEFDEIIDKSSRNLEMEMYVE